MLQLREHGPRPLETGGAPPRDLLPRLLSHPSGTGLSGGHVRLVRQKPRGHRLRGPQPERAGGGLRGRNHRGGWLPPFSLSPSGWAPALGAVTTPGRPPPAHLGPNLGEKGPAASGPICPAVPCLRPVRGVRPGAQHRVTGSPPGLHWGRAFPEALGDCAPPYRTLLEGSRAAGKPTGH